MMTAREACRIVLLSAAILVALTLEGFSADFNLADAAMPAQMPQDG